VLEDQHILSQLSNH